MTSGMTYQECRDYVESQAKRNKTINKECLQQMVLHQVNTFNYYQTDPAIIKAFNNSMDSLLMSLDCYHGFNNRGWIAFCQNPCWHEIVKTLQSLDTDLAWGHKHYWKLLDYLDSVTPGMHFFGGEGFTPTDREKRIAKRLHGRYCRALGLEDGS